MCREKESIFLGNQDSPGQQSYIAWQTTVALDTTIACSNILAGDITRNRDNRNSLKTTIASEIAIAWDTTIACDVLGDVNDSDPDPISAGAAFPSHWSVVV